MAKQTKVGQSKTNGSTQTLHLALPGKIINHLRRMAKADKRSLNFKAREMMESAVYGALGRQIRQEYEAQK